MNKIINKNKIAILLGVYNSELYIEIQIESILSQNYNDWTLYIRDDGSKDNTPVILNKYREMHENIELIKDNDGNLGCNGNYYRLLSMVNSEYYMFCNADDFWYPNKIELSYKRMLYEEAVNKGKPIIVHTDLSIADRDLNQIAKSYWSAVNTNPEKYKSYDKLGICPIVAGATMLFNQSVKNLIFPVFNYEIFFDHWIVLKVVEKGVISSIHMPTMAHRQIGTNLAGVSIGSENSLYFKLKNIKTVIKENKKQAKMLRNIKWGSSLKYIICKISILLTIRFGGRYEKERNPSEE